MAGATAIDVRGLRKTYGSFVAVADIDLTVELGEIFAILGPNGAGKSTTVEILEGFRTRDSGTVQVLGADPASADADWRARVGTVLQTSGFTDELSVREILDHFASFYATPRDTAELLAAVGLTEKAAARARTLSGGQQRRLDVAVGVVGRPELLFLDEPTTGFDPEARRQFWQLIRGLRDEGTTIVLTTHYLDEAEALADRVAVLVGGRVMEVATPATLGGRSGADASVRWVDDDGPHEILTDRPSRVVGELAERFGGEVPELRVMRPSLEDVYLAMVAASQLTGDAERAST
ncbi:MAG: transporter related protein [Acidimicrobiales bacterium]|nr:transporter related protein [Acidimicrobiales bacterium]